MMTEPPPCAKLCHCVKLQNCTIVTFSEVASQESVIVSASLGTTRAILKILCISTNQTTLGMARRRWLEVTEFSTWGRRERRESKKKEGQRPQLRNRTARVSRKKEKWDMRRGKQLLTKQDRTVKRERRCRFSSIDHTCSPLNFNKP